LKKLHAPPDRQSAFEIEDLLRPLERITGRSFGEGPNPLSHSGEQNQVNW